MEFIRSKIPFLLRQSLLRQTPELKVKITLMASEEQTHERFSLRSFCTCEKWHATMRRIGFARLPSITRRKFEIACRTSYTSLLCISLLYIANPYFGPSGFLAPIVSAVSASSLYYGAWAGDLWKVTYAAPLCRLILLCFDFYCLPNVFLYTRFYSLFLYSIAGIIAGYVSWENAVLQLFLLFVGMITNPYRYLTYSCLP